MAPTGGPGGAARERDASERAGERTEALMCGPRYESQAGARWAGLPAGPSDWAARAGRSGRGKRGGPRFGLLGWVSGFLLLFLFQTTLN